MRKEVLERKAVAVAEKQQRLDEAIADAMAAIRRCRTAVHKTLQLRAECCAFSACRCSLVRR